jgi:hypothetical protein
MSRFLSNDVWGLPEAFIIIQLLINYSFGD